MQELKPVDRLSGIIKPSARKWLAKEIYKATIATQYIGWGALDSSTDRYRKLYEEYNLANTGIYTPKDIVWVSSNGARGNRYSPIVDNMLEGVYRNIDRVIEMKATIVMDTAKHLQNTYHYNIGEIQLAEYLVGHLYSRDDNTGIWRPITITSK